MAKIAFYLLMIFLAGGLFAKGLYHKTPYAAETFIREGAFIQVNCAITSKPTKVGENTEYQVWCLTVLKGEIHDEG